MPEITIRDARPGDAPEICRIYRHAVLTGTASFEIDPPDEAEVLKRLTAITSAGYPYLLAERAGAVAGYAYANAYRPRPAYRFSVEDSIYVAPEAQGVGIGRGLLAALVDRCTVAGFRQMIAVIGDSRQAGSIRLHRGLGFTFVGTIHAVGYKHGRWLDSVLMQRGLGPGDTTDPA